MAQRIGTRAWLDRDLRLSDTERTRRLSGPGSLTATIRPDLRAARGTDGRLVLEDYGTFIHAVEEDPPYRVRGTYMVVPPTSYEEQDASLTCPGFAGYSLGFIRVDTFNWGPQVDPLVVFRDHWTYIEQHNPYPLGVSVVGTEESIVRIGNNEEPYRLFWYDTPDLGEELNNLASGTPFDYVEEQGWDDLGGDDVDLTVRVGWPRLGRQREDLSFRLGENIIETVPAVSSSDYANQIVGIGNGEGATLVYCIVNTDDGRARVTKRFTDKTIKDVDLLTDKCRGLLDQYSAHLDIASVVVRDTPAVPLSAVDLGDDIFIQTFLPSYGDINLWVRVLAITESDTTPHQATLTVQRASAFRYNTNEEIA